MFNDRRSIRRPLLAAVAVLIALTTACGNVTGPQPSPLKAPDAPSRYIQPSGPRTPAPIPTPTQRDSTGGKNTLTGYNVWA
jgi:hypothetical protein